MKAPCLFGSAAVALLSLSAASQSRAADVIPYPSAGSYNATTYSFTASATGNVIAYIVGGFTAAYQNQIGLLDNGVLTSAGYGLDNHTSTLGTSFDLGTVTKGDTLTFVLNNLTLGAKAYSNPALNVGYDLSTDTIGHNHIYSTAYTATSPLLDSAPTGTYVAFEDLRFPASDFNYNDESFIFTDVSTAVPEPATWAFMLIGVGAVGYALRRGASTASLPGA